jgi:acyl carrier protein
MEDTIKNILATQFGIEASAINNDMSIVNDLGADSIDVVELIMELETVFNLELETDESNAADTVQKIIDLITLKLQK